MTWVYQQSTGHLTKDGILIAVGYSGLGDGENNPESQNIPSVGPIPQGGYVIGSAFTDGSKGQVVMRLTPYPDNQTFGRDGFLIHGDNSLGNQSASHGCIILGRVTRNMIASSDDRILQVIA